MSDTKISGLNEKTTLHDTDLVPIVDVVAHPDETKKITGANLKSAVAAASATTELDNLGTVAINTSLISDTDNTDDLGSAAKEWKDAYIDGTAYIDNIEIASGETITGNGTNMTLASGGSILLTAATSVTVPANVPVTFGTGEKVEGDNTDLTVTSGAKINLSAYSDVIVPVNVGLVLGDGAEKIESDNADLTIASGGELLLSATSDVVIPVNVGLHLGDGGEKLESDDANLTINSGGELRLTATSDVVLPVSVGLHLGDGTSKLESNDTDLTINAGGDIALTATSNINVPSGVGMTFGDDGEKIEGDGTDLTIASSGVLSLNSTGNLEASHQGITDNHVLTVDGSPSDNEYAKFTANGLEGRSYSEVVSDTLSSFADQLTGAHLSQTFGAAAGRLHNLIVTPIGGEVLRILGCGASPFDGDIAGAPNATTVVYDGETKESMFTGLAAYDGSAYWGQIILHNTTRSNSRKIVSVNTGTNTITTTSSTDDWADDDVITCQSQTNAQAGYIDIEVSDNVATTTGSVFIFATFDDAEGNLDGNRYVMFHPFATYDQGKRQWLSATNASEKSSLTFPLQVVSQKFTVFLGSGCNGVNLVLAIKAEVEYADT